MPTEQSAASVPAPRFVLITGMAGAGRSYAIKCLEDLGYFCVDNLPTTLIPTFAELCEHSSRDIRMIALGVDIREGEYLAHLMETLDKLRAQGHKPEVLFLEAGEETLVRRYQETRRRHPLAGEGSVLEGKAYLTVAIGCTGGRHRSVTLVESLRRALEATGAAPVVRHRDIDRE